MKVGSVKAGGVPLVTIAVAGLAKPFMERAIAMTPIGNGNIVSGVAKLVGAVAIRKMVGNSSIANGIQIGLAVDGMEDIIMGATGAFVGGGSAQANNW